MKDKFAYSINIRKLVKPPLPAGYWRNGCVPIYVQLSAKDLIERPIWETAELIKKSKSNITGEYVRSFIDFLKLNCADGSTAGKRVSGFTDWRQLGHSTVDCGWEGPVTVFPNFFFFGTARPAQMISDHASERSAPRSSRVTGSTLESETVLPSPLPLGVCVCV